MKPSVFLSLVVVFMFMASTCSACCCTYMTSCRCNVFGCNCDTHNNGYCYAYNDDLCTCSTCGDCFRFTDEVCAEFASDVFDSFDVNKDGVISFEEVSSGRNITTVDFFALDKDKDGFV